jgi:hypothetical protein
MRGTIFVCLALTAGLLAGCHEPDPQQVNAFMHMPPDMNTSLTPAVPGADGKPAAAAAPAAAPARGPATGP